ncbi:hypothetical protein B0J18DRAFT_295390 [Chaetomium sp. MPI-SDFR-AT-0129]|nr:hypothetical protein B0J18DRAFT_295390 [Chaetomium sp. MPI-SDFR-AT-0129]
MGVEYPNPDNMATRADAATTFTNDEFLVDALLHYRPAGYRAWDRVPVAPVPDTRRQPKIWKRVGGLPVDPTQRTYQRSMAELESQGEGPRKRARHLRWVPAWGDMKWHGSKGVEYTPEDILAAARAAVLANENESVATPYGDGNEPLTYPANALKYVPRKRHNTRWPIEPKKTTTATTMVGELQPLIEYEIPASPEHVETRVEMDEQQMMKRSTRSPSKRCSIIPGQDSPRKLPMIRLTPAENTSASYSPVKRLPVLPSPTKVADSPHRDFKMNATPTKVILETPKISPPSQSPLKSSTPSTPGTEDSMYSLFGTPPPESPGSPLPLTFDQPVADVQITPEHEARRRISLQSARRRSRDSPGLLRILALKKSAAEGANRRHSLPSLEELSAEVHGTSSSSKKGRRKTMDPFCVDDDGVGASAGSDERAATTTKEVLEIDMKTSPDIFGQPVKGPELPESAGSNEPEEAVSSAASETEGPSTPSPASAVSSPAAHVPEATTDTVSPSGDSISALGATPEKEEGRAGAENATPGQAATPPSANQTNIAHDTSVTTSQIAADPFKLFGSGPESEVMFVPEEPEGLSTIYEESTILESSPLKGVAPSAGLALNPDAGSPTATSLTPDTESTTIENRVPATPDAGMLDPASTAADISPDQQLQNELMLASDAATNGAEKPTASPQLPLPNGDATSSDPTKDVSSTPVSGNLKDGKSLFHLERFPVPASVMNPDFDSPFTAALRDLMQQADPRPAEAKKQPESSGFTPINGRTFTPDFEQKLREQDEAQVDHDMDGLDADEVIEQEEVEVVEGEEATVALDATDALDVIDENATVQPPRPENDTLQLLGRQPDPEADMLRDFVTRVTADKNAKAAAAAAALVKKIARRSSSLGSTTSATGSPMAKLGSPTSRTPLGVKSPNSPSLSKKRKAEDSPAKDEASQVSPDESSDQPRLKRRKRADPVLENSPETTTENPSPERGSRSPGRGPRRSTRARRALRPAAPSANSIALSMIPVRLPGMGAMDEAAMDAHTANMMRQREEKDLVSITRVNTRKNKGTAVPPQAVLAKQAEDPAAWRMRELKGVFDAKDKRGKASAAGTETGNDAQEQKEDNDSGAESKTAAKQRKGVRWAEELVRFQTEDPSIFHGMARSLLADVMSEGDDDFDEIAEAEPPRPATPVVEKTARVAARKSAPAAATETTATGTATVETAAAAAPLANVPSSRTRSKRASRLQPPTPVKSLRSTDTTESAAPAAKRSTTATKKTATAKKSTSTTSSAGVKKPNGVKKPTSTATSSASASSTNTASSATGLRARARPLSKRAAAAATAALAEVEEIKTSSSTSTSSRSSTSSSSAAPSKAATTTPKASGSGVGAGARGSGGSSAASGMATRRTRVTKLGMSANGTPAPKRRGRAAGSAAKSGV